MVKIAEMMLTDVEKRLCDQGMKLSYNEEILRMLAKDGYDPTFGARPLRRVIQRTVEDTLSEEIIAGRLTLGDHVTVYVNEGKIAIRKATEPIQE
jgi:ATP-dependent Clp protease ATP-binding subunit ClpC